MFFRKIFFLFLLGIFALNTNVFAASITISDTNKSPVYANGFRDMEWGSDAMSFEEKGISFTEIGFDRQKKLFTYMLVPEQYAIYDTGFYPIFYHFWDGRFVAIRAYFNGDKDAGAYQKLYENLISQLGLPKESVSRGEEDDVQWVLGDTGVKLTYNQIQRTGLLYVYSISLQEQYRDFVKKLPASNPNYPNQPKGFMSFEWHMTKEQFKENGLNLRPVRDESILGDYMLAKDKKEFMGVPVSRITYGFFENQLWAAYIYYQNDSEKAAFSELQQKMSDYYGLPAYGRYEETSKMHYYLWAGEETHIMLYHLENQKESYIFFASVDLYNKKSVK